MNAKPHLQRSVESVNVPEFEMDFCYLLHDPKRRHQPLVMVEVAAQNPLCAALSTMSDENAYLSAMCAAFAKRMRYVKAVLKVDPEPPLKALADRSALEASADGIQPKVETAPRLSSHNIGATLTTMSYENAFLDAVCESSSEGRDEHNTQWKGQIRCLRLELERRLSIEVTPAMDVWPWLVRHAGWSLEKYHMKSNKKTAFEDCFGKPY